MSTVRLRHINPIGQVDVPILDRQGEPYDEHGTGCLEPGEVFDCDAATAGRPPKLTKDGKALALDDDGQPIDYGEGLLAQFTNYELADKPARKTAAKKTAEPSPPLPDDDTPAPADSDDSEDGDR